MELEVRDILDKFQKAIEDYGQEWREIGRKEGYNEGLLRAVDAPDSPEFLKEVVKAASAQAYDDFMTS